MPIRVACNKSMQEWHNVLDLIRRGHVTVRDSCACVWGCSMVLWRVLRKGSVIGGAGDIAHARQSSHDGAPAHHHGDSTIACGAATRHNRAALIPIPHPTAPRKRTRRDAGIQSYIQSQILFVQIDLSSSIQPITQPRGSFLSAHLHTLLYRTCSF